MADFNGTILTDNGRNLLSKALTGTALQFTKVSIGDGVWDSDVSPENLNDLISKKIDLPINTLDVTGDGTARLRFVLTNTGLTDGFFTREIGIYANDPDLGEILYAVTYSNNPDFIPSDGVVKVENVTDIYTVVSNAQNIEAVISDTVVIATKDDVKNLAGVDDSLILSKIKNVDGSGSGLDADLVRGGEPVKLGVNEIIKTDGSWITNQITAFVRFNYDSNSGDITLYESYNVSSVVREDTGIYTVYFENEMNNTNYSTIAMVNTQSMDNNISTYGTIATDKRSIRITDNNDNEQDATPVAVMFLGGK